MSHPNLKIQRAGRIDMRAMVARRLTGLWRFGGRHVINECNGYVCSTAGVLSQGGRVYRVGTDSVALAATSAEYPGNVACTFAAWFKAGTATGTDFIFTSSNATSAAGYEILSGIAGGTGNPIVRVNSGIPVGSPVAVAGQESVVFGTVNPGTLTSGWHNGRLQGTSATTPSGANTQVLSVNIRGASVGGAGSVMRMVAYWDRVLAPSEIIALSADPTALFKQRRRVYSIPSGSSAKPWLYRPSTSVVYGYGMVGAA